MRLERQVKKQQQQAKVLSKEDPQGYIVMKKEADYSNDTYWRDKSKDIGKRNETQKISRQGSCNKTKRDIPK